MLNKIAQAPIVFAICFLTLVAGAAEERKTFIISRTDSPPTIDGRLDDPAWMQATVVDDFHQNTPNYREAATELTVVRLLYDDDFLYIGADLHDSNPDKIIATQLIQGRGITSDDRFLLAVDSFNSKRNDYLFTVNANSIRGDILRESNSRFIAEWGAIWRAESALNDHGWATEIAIPFKSISFDPNSETWGMNFGRWIMRKQAKTGRTHPSCFPSSTPCSMSGFY